MSNENISTNLDTAEGTFDAALQASVCSEVNIKYAFINRKLPGYTS